MAAPPIPQPTPAYSQGDMAYTLRVIEQRFQDLERPVATGYRVDNPPPSARTIDASTAGLSEVRDLLATLIADLKTRGVLG